MLYSIVAILIIIIDQAVKLMVNNMVVGGETVKTLIPGVISLVRVQNDGAAFSFLAGGGARIWFIILTLIFVALVIIALVTNFISGRFGRWCMVIVAAGGLANCIDRVLYGYVLDMFRVDLFNFAVFNVADIFITVGCIAFIIYILFGGEKDSTPADEYDEEDDEDADTPVRQPLFKKRKSYYEEDDDEYDDDDEDDDYEEVAPRKSVSRKSAPAAAAKKQPAKVASKASAKPARSSNNSEEILERARAAKAAEKTAARRTAEDEAQAFEDFFKKRAESKQAPAETVQPRAKAPVSVQRTARPAAPVEEPVKPAPVQRKQVVDTPVQEPVVAKQPVVTYTEPVSVDDFDLDSILNEFK